MLCPSRLEAHVGRGVLTGVATDFFGIALNPAGSWPVFVKVG